MPNDPWYLTLLEKVGVNTTKLRWRLYQREQQGKGPVHGEDARGPSWLKYAHKVCPHCGAVNDRESFTCASCERDLPTMFRYRVNRIYGSLVPKEGPVVTMAFLMLIVLVYGVEYAANGFRPGAIMQPNNPSIYVVGGFAGDWAVGDGQYWRFLSFGLLHGGLIHFAMIGYSLYQIGQLLESQLDRARMLGLITFTQLCAAVGTYFWYSMVQNNPAPTVGGSGWLYGLLGFGIAYFHQMGPRARQMRDSLMKWAMIWLVLGMIIPGINNAAHIGGLLGGLAFAYAPEGSTRDGRGTSPGWSAIFWLCVVAWAMTLFFMAKSVVHYWPELMRYV